MATDPSDDDRRQLVRDVEAELGRRLNDDETRLATRLMHEKSPALIAREIAGAPITDAKKIRPEHKDTADE